MANKKIMAGVIVLALVCSKAALCAESYPDFSEKYWQNERDKAKGKIWRGAALGALGVAAFAPTTVLAIKAAKNPEKFLAWSAVTGIAALGMTFHGFFSISFGKSQREKADYFLQLYGADPAGVAVDEERKYYMHTQKKAAKKMILFGSVLAAQSTILLANGIVLSIRKHKGVDIGNIRIWPSFLVGGLLLSGGTALAIMRSLSYHNLSTLERETPSSGAALSIKPYFEVDNDTGAYNYGLIGQLFY